MIGIFDSGYGGLTVIKQLIKELPAYDYLYLGDNARAPYGSKSQAVIYNYTREAVEFLFSRGCELIIIACNTASAKALRKIQREFVPEHYPNHRVLGVLIPVVEAVAEQPGTKPIKLGIIGTKATIESGAYEKEIKKHCKTKQQILIYNQACPLLVPLIEEGWINKRETKMILRQYLRPLKGKKINHLILGCTHYPLIEKQIREVAGKNTRIISTPETVAAKLKDYLKRHPETEKKLSKKKKRTYYTTDDPGRMKLFAQQFLKIKIDKAEKIRL